MEHTISVPSGEGLGDCLQFVKSLWNIPSADQYIFDFQHVRFMRPLALVLWASEIQRFVREKADSRHTAANFGHLTYPAHMGFFRSFGPDFEKLNGEAPGNENYIPITQKNCHDLVGKAAETYKDVGEVIEEMGGELAAVLVRSNTGVLFDTLKYSLSEVIRNVLDHSRSEDFWFCAQYWPGGGKVELAILDRGSGVRNSLSGNPHLTIRSDEEALKLALLPGVSGTAFKGRARGMRGHWDNAGFGLYMTNRLCRNGGSFFIASYSSGLFLDGETTVPYPAKFNGTVLRLILRVKNLTDLQTMLDRFHDEGKACAARFGNEDKLSASTAVHFLNSDFKNDVPRGEPEMI